MSKNHFIHEARETRTFSRYIRYNDLLYFDQYMSQKGGAEDLLVPEAHSFGHKQISYLPRDVHPGQKL